MYRRELTMRVASSVIPVLRSSGQVAEGFRLQRLERDRDVVLELLFDRTIHGSLRSETGVETLRRSTFYSEMTSYVRTTRRCRRRPVICWRVVTTDASWHRLGASVARATCL